MNEDHAIQLEPRIIELRCKIACDNMHEEHRCQKDEDAVVAQDTGSWNGTDATMADRCQDYCEEVRRHGC